MQVYAYSMIIRKKDGKLSHQLSHCWAHSKQEARGLAQEQFDNDYPNCELASILIRLIDTNLEDGDDSRTEDAPQVPEHKSAQTKIRPEFTLANKL